MSRYTYTIYKQGDKKDYVQSAYLYSDLIQMTTFQLREICKKERLVKNALTVLDREELIRLIVRYRGRKQALWIKEDFEGGFERLDSFVRRTEIVVKQDKRIQIPAKLVLYKGLDLDYFDRCHVQTGSRLSEGNLLLVDEQYQLYCIFNLEKTPDDIYFITKSYETPLKEISRKQYSILYTETRESELLYQLFYNKITVLPNQLAAYQIPIVDIQVKELPNSEVPLVIDFGTSNTTAGIFAAQQEYKVVNALKKSKERWEETTVIPSVIGIKEIEGDSVQYKFGHEAVLITENNYLDEELPVFHDIKRWINDAERQEKVMSRDGVYTWIKRSDLLKVYLKHIIGLGEQRFKCRFKNIQILSPVRQREKFRRVFADLLSGYKVECTLDEGSAVLFQSIGQFIKKNEYERNHWYRAMIIDCGGGTTDLSTCDFKIDNNRVSYQIDLECSYENGDTNFGGNNLTYRIMQLLKIRLAYQMNGTIEEGNLQCLTSNNFRFVDQYGAEKVYEELERVYETASGVIPTRFFDYEQVSAKDYFKVKSNYYYLFEVAEKIKKLFFSEDEIYEVTISWKDSLTPDYGDVIEIGRRKIRILLDKWKLSVLQNNQFINIIPEGEVILNLYEIKALLMPDIYDLMKKFMEQGFKRGELDQYELIKLTGQSCQSELFVEALKEFIPGRVIQHTSKQKDPYELKVCCLSGALFYFQNKKLGYMEINQSYKSGVLPYELMAYTHEGQEAVLVQSLSKRETTGYISRFMEGEQVELFLKDTSGNKLKSYFYYCQADDMEPVTFEEIEEEYPGKIIQDETDNIVNGESKFFVWVSKELWGFYVLSVMRRQERLFKGDVVFYDFEDDTWERNFFDGTK